MRAGGRRWEGGEEEKEEVEEEGGSMETHSKCQVERKSSVLFPMCVF